jgi:hypothetical protein
MGQKIKHRQLANGKRPRRDSKMSKESAAEEMRRHFKDRRPKNERSIRSSYDDDHT